jgi:hypothetical protein
MFHLILKVGALQKAVEFMIPTPKVPTVGAN